MHTHKNCRQIMHTQINTASNNNKRQFVRCRNVSVDITRAPYRQSGNVVRDSGGTAAAVLLTVEWPSVRDVPLCRPIVTASSRQQQVNSLRTKHLYNPLISPKG